MPSDFDFNDNYDVEKLKEEENPELIKNITTENTGYFEDNSEDKKAKKDFLDVDFPFPEMFPEEQQNQQQVNSNSIENNQSYIPENNNYNAQSFNHNELSIPYDTNQVSNSYLSLVLAPNLRELELMIRGLEYIRKRNPITNKEEYILRKIENHPLNEYGINQIITQLKIYTSPEIKLGRKHAKDYFNSIRHVSRTIVRLIYKNLKSFGMDTQEKQRNAKVFCDAIIEVIDASYSRSIEGRENDLSRATSFEISGSIDSLDNPAEKLFNKGNKNNKQGLKN